jgi:hypothetical protein
MRVLAGQVTRQPGESLRRKIATGLVMAKLAAAKLIGRIADHKIMFVLLKFLGCSNLPEV